MSHRRALVLDDHGVPSSRCYAPLAGGTGWPYPEPDIRRRESNLGAEIAIAVIRRKERRVRDAFHKAGALDPAGARPLSDIGLEESMALRRLERREVVRESSPGCYYFDEEVWQTVRAARRRMGLMIAAALVLTALVGLYAASANR